MKSPSFKPIPVAIALTIIGTVCGLRALRMEVLERPEAVSQHAPAMLAVRQLLHEVTERPELMTYDFRVRLAARLNSPGATNLGFVCIDEPSVEFVRDQPELGYNYGLYWPRHIYGRIVSELAAQGARGVAFDVIFGELRPDHNHELVDLGNGAQVTPDQFFATQVAKAGNVILSTTPDKPTPPFFATNAMALGDIQTQKDFDGILRRAKAFRIYRQWHRVFELLAADPDYAVHLDEARIEPGALIFPRHVTLGPDTKPEDLVLRIPLAPDGTFDLADLVKVPEGKPHRAQPFTEQRIWHLGIQLAARDLGLDLDHAEVNLPQGRIVFRGRGGLQRVIPVDSQAFFYVDWAMSDTDPDLSRQGAREVLEQEYHRRTGDTNALSNPWKDKLVVIGSAAVGNDLSDRGATPLQSDALLVSKHWNVANSVLTDRFVHRSSLPVDLTLIVGLAVLTALLTWNLRALSGLGIVLALMLAYAVLATALYIKARLWLPIILPMGGAMLVEYFSLLAYQVIFEQAERRRIKAIFSNMVSPKIVNKLLAEKTLGLGGSRCEITVLFADVRGFTEFTDVSQKQVAEHIARHQLTGAAAEACYERQASETLRTVNTYLGLVADRLIRDDGTLDKFIGDCVMAFWGAPTANPRHAVGCVRAAIDAQRAIHALNRTRAVENGRRELENEARRAAGQAELPLLAILTLGTGINTGLATAGLMGSEQTRQFNYTVFGRDVNLASRLEGASGRGRIFISEATFEHLQRDDPALAATCVEQPEALKLKGFSAPVRVFEVPWRPPGDNPLEGELPIGRPDTTAFFPRPPATTPPNPGT